MGTKEQINQLVNLKDIIVEKEIYPRENHSWLKAYEYSQAMLTGASFPRIVLGLYKDKLYLIDGKHRMEATKTLKKTQIEAVVHKGLSTDEMFKMAVQFNVTHGLGLSVYDRRKATLKLLRMGMNPKEVSSLVNVPEDKLQTFVEQRMVNTLTGLESSNDFTALGQEILKTVFKHHVGDVGNEASRILELQKGVLIAQQLTLWKDAAHLLENKMVDDKDAEVVKQFNKTKRLIKSYKL